MAPASLPSSEQMLTICPGMQNRNCISVIPKKPGGFPTKSLYQQKDVLLEYGELMDSVLEYLYGNHWATVTSKFMLRQRIIDLERQVFEIYPSQEEWDAARVVCSLLHFALFHCHSTYLTLHVLAVCEQACDVDGAG